LEELLKLIVSRFDGIEKYESHKINKP
jgi:hypothetical protein